MGLANRLENVEFSVQASVRSVGAQNQSLVEERSRALETSIKDMRELLDAVSSEASRESVDLVDALARTMNLDRHKMIDRLTSIEKQLEEVSMRATSGTQVVKDQLDKSVREAFQVIQDMRSLQDRFDRKLTTSVDANIDRMNSRTREIEEKLEIRIGHLEDIVRMEIRARKDNEARVQKAFKALNQRFQTKFEELQARVDERIETNTVDHVLEEATIRLEVEELLEDFVPKMVAFEKTATATLSQAEEAVKRAKNNQARATDTIDAVMARHIPDLSSHLEHEITTLRQERKLSESQLRAAIEDGVHKAISEAQKVTSTVLKQQTVATSELTTKTSEIGHQIVHMETELAEVMGKLDAVRAMQIRSSITAESAGLEIGPSSSGDFTGSSVVGNSAAQRKVWSEVQTLRVDLDALKSMVGRQTSQMNVMMEEHRHNTGRDIESIKADYEHWREQVSIDKTRADSEWKREVGRLIADAANRESRERMQLEQRHDKTTAELTQTVESLRVEIRKEVPRLSRLSTDAVQELSTKLSIDLQEMADTMDRSHQTLESAYKVGEAERNRLRNAVQALQTEVNHGKLKQNEVIRSIVAKETSGYDASISEGLRVIAEEARSMVDTLDSSTNETMTSLEHRIITLERKIATASNRNSQAFPMSVPPKPGGAQNSGVNYLSVSVNDQQPHLSAVGQHASAYLLQAEGEDTPASPAQVYSPVMQGVMGGNNLTPAHGAVQGLRATPQDGGSASDVIGEEDEGDLVPGAVVDIGNRFRTGALSPFRSVAGQLESVAEGSAEGSQPSSPRSRASSRLELGGDEDESDGELERSNMSGVRGGVESVGTGASPDLLRDDEIGPGDYFEEDGDDEGDGPEESSNRDALLQARGSITVSAGMAGAGADADDDEHDDDEGDAVSSKLRADNVEDVELAPIADLGGDVAVGETVSLLTPRGGRAGATVTVDDDEEEYEDDHEEDDEQPDGDLELTESEPADEPEMITPRQQPKQETGNGDEPPLTTAGKAVNELLDEMTGATAEEY